MTTRFIALAAVGLLAVACDRPTATAPTVTASTVDHPLLSARGNGVVHQVSVGGSDAVPPGTDANFSLLAIQHADGSVSGQWSDQFGHGNGGLHVVVNCVNVDGHRAWISGTITGPSPYAGMAVITEVVDNGTSVHDPADQITYTFEDTYGGCVAGPDLPLSAISNGQVKVQ